MSTQAELVVDARCGTGESPVWSAAEQALYWVDIPGRALHRWDQDGHRHWTGEEMLACIAPRADAPGRWIAGMESGLFSIAPQDDGTLAATPLAQVTHARPGMRFNDGRCDRQGRFWAGTMLMDMGAGARVGRLYRHDGNGRSPSLQLEDLIVPNGLAFSPDGRTMYLSDSHPSVQAIWAFDYDTATGTPTNRRLFADMNPLPGRPDGAAVDVEGAYWVAMFEGARILRLSPTGDVLREIALPVRCPTMPCLGGPDLRTLYVTSARAHRPPQELSATPLAGCVLQCRVDVPGLPVNFMQG